MAVQLIKSPLGHKLSESSVDAVIIDDGTGDALVYTGFAHALVDGDYVYIESNFDSYNGYKYVDSISYDTFKIKDSENSDNVEFVQDADISYRTSVLNHGWLCAHLPIVFEFESDIYPNNISEEEYNPVTVVSQSEEGGLTRLALSGEISDPTELAYISLVGGDMEGVYQIITVYQPWNIVIDLSYDASNNFGGSQIVKWYNNYAINIEVWCGLTPEHRWATLYPFELSSTLQVIPDDNGLVKVSLSDIIRSYIKTRNNLTLNTLPNNLDFMISFFIKYYESYDQSDGEDITTYIGTPNVPNFVGNVVNAKLPFKSENISSLSDYINEDVYLANWLTLQERPIAVVDRFFDISFINRFAEVDLIVVIDKSTNGVTTDTETLTITNPGYGVIRVPINAESGFDEYCLEAHSGPGSEIVPADTLDLSTFLSYPGAGHDWGLGSMPSFDTSEMDILYGSFAAANGSTTIFHYRFSVNSIVGSVSMVFKLASGSPDGANDSGTILVNHTGEYTGDLSILATADRIYLSIQFSIPGVIMDGFLISIGYGSETTVVIPGVQITERICIDILEECESTFIDTPDDIRLTEDGDFRILE